MKSLTTLVTLVITMICHAQIFTEISEPPVFDGFSSAQISTSDFNGDGLPDVMITGEPESQNTSTCVIYLNAGEGEFTDVPDLPFSDFLITQHFHIDFDSDGDLDIVLRGVNEFNLQVQIQTYLNDGEANYTAHQSFYLLNDQNGKMALADFNNDGHLDIFISATSASSQEGFYMNNGTSLFVLDETDYFPVANLISVKLADFDQNGFVDILARGDANGVDEMRTVIFFNDGMDFSADTDVPFFENSSIVSTVADFDNDGDEDIVIKRVFTLPIGAFYAFFANDGSGNFEEISAPVDLESTDDLHFLDIDMDEDLDLMVLENYNDVPIIYLNNGAGEYTAAEHELKMNLQPSGFSFFDFDNDGDMDFIESGYAGFEALRTRLFENTGDLIFEPKHYHDLSDSYRTKALFGDFDSDQTNDVLIIDGDPLQYREIYNNSGGGQFHYDKGLDVVCGKVYNTESTGIDLGDIDDDGDLDIVSTGTSFEYDEWVCTLFLLNDGAGNFTEVEDTGLPELTRSMIKLTDIEGDGDLDFLIVGRNQTNSVVQYLGFNDGTGNFELVEQFLDLSYFTPSNFSFSDIDQDGDMDLLLSRTSGTSGVLDLYRFDGISAFVLDSDFSFAANVISSSQFGDLDSDGDQDILVFGKSLELEAEIWMFLNNGTGQFTLVSETGITPLLQAKHELVDFDLDGDLDLLLRGDVEYLDERTYLYENPGDASFELHEDSGLPEFASGNFIIPDLDNDGDSDLVLFDNKSNRARVFLNTTILSVFDQFPTATFDFTIFPNPVERGEVNLRLNAASHLTVRVEIYNATGQLIDQKQFFISEGESVKELSTDFLNAGIYMISISAENFRTTKRFVLN